MRPHSATCKTIRQTNRRASKRGFTLIELLVVVAIIALLISILLPSLARARDVARSTKCLANMRDMFVGTKTFVETHRGRFQPLTTWSNITEAEKSQLEWSVGDNFNRPGDKELMAWTTVLVREATPKAIVRNRAYKNLLKSGGRVPPGAGWGTMSSEVDLMVSEGSLPKFEQLICPSAKLTVNMCGVSSAAPGVGGYYGHVTYGINQDITGVEVGQTWNNGVRAFGYNDVTKVKAGDRLRGKLEKVFQPSTVVMYSDAGADGGGMGWNDLRLSTDGSPKPCGPLLEHMDSHNSSSLSGGSRLPYKRHRGVSVNVVYVDGHGSFCKRVSKTPLISDDTDFAYTPSSRVSPYKPGIFPQ